LSEQECKLRLTNLKPDAVLVSALSVEYHQQYHAAAGLAKEVWPQALTVIGGVYPTVLAEEALKDPHVDYIFLGHAEERIQEFLAMVIAGDVEGLNTLPGIGFVGTDGQPTINPPTTYIADVKQFVRPDYSAVELTPYLHQNSMTYQFNSDHPMASIITSYGCPFNCVFCATRTISGRRVVYRPVEDVLEEVEFLVDRYGVRELLFLDDALLGDRKRIVCLLNEFINRDYGLTWKTLNVAAWHLDDELLDLMKRSGCKQICISVESGSPRVLREIIRKPLKLEIVPPLAAKCRELDIYCCANFVIGFPGESWDELRQTFRFAESCNFDVVQFYIATPLPKTDLYEMAREQGLLPEDFSFTDPRYFGFGHGFIATDEFTPFELSVLRAFEWDRINFSTPEKRARIAEIYGTSVQEMSDHRRLTRRSLGTHFGTRSTSRGE
jgi:radical SAM superfamily enzyme YgiQ (UPF0313 family)